MNHGSMKIVADSSADLFELKKVPFAAAPLKIMTGQKEYVDDINLNVEEMVADMLATTEQSRTACPSPEDWINAFGDAQNTYCASPNALPQSGGLDQCIWGCAVCILRDYHKQPFRKQQFR